MSPSVDWATLEPLRVRPGTTQKIALEVFDGASPERGLHDKVSVARNEPPVAQAGGVYGVSLNQKLYLDGSGLTTRTACCPR